MAARMTRLIADLVEKMADETARVAVGHPGIAFFVALPGDLRAGRTFA